MRIATVTGWLADLDGHLAITRFATSKAGVNLRDQIREFTAGALPRASAGRVR
jgi:hypothetical protein